MRAFSLGTVMFITALAFACSDSASRRPSTLTSPDPVAATGSGTGGVSGATATRLSATVQFGLPNVGSHHPIGEDESGHADDTLVPQTVVIDKGGTVTFNAVSIHQIAIYEDGKQPEDVNTSTLVAMPCPDLPPFRINDPAGRIAINGANPVGCGPRTYTHSFAAAGKYLVICEVLPHFNIRMYGWVVVRDR